MTLPRHGILAGLLASSLFATTAAAAPVALQFSIAQLEICDSDGVNCAAPTDGYTLSLTFDDQVIESGADDNEPTCSAGRYSVRPR